MGNCYQPKKNKNNGWLKMGQYDELGVAGVEKQGKSECCDKQRSNMPQSPVTESWDRRQEA